MDVWILGLLGNTWEILCRGVYDRRSLFKWFLNTGFLLCYRKYKFLIHMAKKTNKNFDQYKQMQVNAVHSFSFSKCFPIILWTYYGKEEKQQQQ